MNKFKFYFILSIITVSLFSCSKDDNSIAVEPLRAYADQYTTDIADIEGYLSSNYITVVNNPGFADDQDVTITKIPDGGAQPSIMSYLNSATYPKLLTRDVSQNNITYKLYYLVLREGIGEYPCNTDNILTAYKGEYLSRETISNVTTLKTTFFEEVKFPQSMKDLSGLDLISQGKDLIKGWKEVFPQFKTGTYTANADGTVSYFNFGAGVVFIPSGLAYYNSGSDSIPAYSPLIFNIKLYQIQRLDHDSDGVIDFDEDLDHDRYTPYFRELVAGASITDDTDKDGNPDFLDVDDDGDNYTTKLEIKDPITGLPYPFASIPTCTSGKKNYLDVTCHP